MKKKDKAFLTWVYFRLKNVYKENPLFDYMNEMRRIIDDGTTDVDKWEKNALKRLDKN